MKRYAHWLCLPVPLAVLWVEFYLLWGSQHWLGHWWGFPLAFTIIVIGAATGVVAFFHFLEKV